MSSMFSRRIVLHSCNIGIFLDLRTIKSQAGFLEKVLRPLEIAASRFNPETPIFGTNRHPEVDATEAIVIEEVTPGKVIVFLHNFVYTILE